MKKVFSESGLNPHLYLWVAGLVTLILFFGYIFWFEHKEDIDRNNFWIREFERQGVSKEQIKDITHDGDTWYYQKVSTCVGYGNMNEKCPKNETYCSGGETYGSPEQQTKSVYAAIQKGGVHEKCPIIYGS